MCDTCLFFRHAHFTLKKLAARGLSQQSNPQEYVKGVGGVTVYEPATHQILTGLSAPNEKALVPWLKAHPSYKVFMPSGKGRAYTAVLTVITHSPLFAFSHTV